MATKTEQEAIAVLNTQMTEVLRRLDGLDKKLDSQGLNYASHLELKGLRDEFVAFKRQYWLSHTLTALITAMITGLVFYFLKVHP